MSKYSNEAFNELTVLIKNSPDEVIRLALLDLANFHYNKGIKAAIEALPEKSKDASDYTRWIYDGGINDTVDQMEAALLKLKKG